MALGSAFIYKSGTAPTTATPVSTTSFVPQSDSGLGWTPIMGMGMGIGRSSTGESVTPRTALQLAAVFSCVRSISSDIAKLPLRVMIRQPEGNWQASPDHPLQTLFNKPNQRQTLFYFLQHMVVSHQLAGNAYAVVIRKQDGTASQLIPIMPGSVSPHEDASTGELTYHATSTMFGKFKTSNPRQRGPTRTISHEDMIHLKGLSLNGDIWGQGAIELVGEMFGLAIAGQKLAATTYANGATFNGILSNPNKLTQEQVMKTGQAFSESFSGVNNAGKVAILTGGSTFQKTNMSPEESQLLESRRFMVEEVCRAFSFPPHKSGLLDGAKYNNIEQMNKDYIDGCLNRITIPLEQVMNDVLLPTSLQSQIRFEFDYTKMSESDTQTRWTTFQIGLTNGFITPNWVAEREGLPFIPANQGGDTYHRPLNTGVSGDQAGEPLVDGDHNHDGDTGNDGDKGE